MAEGKGTGEIARLVGLSFSQLKYIGQLCPVYVRLRDYAKRLEKLRVDAPSPRT